MARLTAEEYQEKQARRLKGSLDDIRRGINKVTVSPTSQAVLKLDKMKANLDEAFASGRVKAGLESVSLEEWKNSFLEKGVGRIASGIDAAKTKNIQMAGRLLAAVDSVAAEVRNMPDLSIEDSVARAEKMMRGMHAFKGKI